MDRYIKLLSSYKWKRKCRQILKRDNYQCTACGIKSNLQVHHTFYYEDYPNPWLYSNDSLITLCKNCHKDYHLYHEIEIVKRPLKKNVNKKRNKKHKIKRQLCLSEIQLIRGTRIRERQVKL
jgi:5-methylcytosine-specific restriction endonuclease McrA